MGWFFFLNTPKLDQNQPKINEKSTFEHLDRVMSDLSKVFEMDDIFT
jgi:hypothetical protein